MSRAVREVVLTGVGLHSTLGDVDDAWEALAAGRSALAMTVPSGVRDFPEVPGAPAANASPAQLIENRKLVKYMSPTTAMATVAAGRALAHAGLVADERRSGLGLFVAVGYAAFDLADVRGAIETARGADGGLDLERMGREGLRACHPLMPFKSLLNMPLGIISIAYGIRGPNFVLYPGAREGASCLEAAVRAVRHGRCDGALVGGSSNGFSLLPISMLLRLGRLARSVEEAVPYRAGHRGIAPADAACFLVIEAREHAERREARILACLGDTGALERAPDLLLSVGTVDEAADRAELEAARTSWGEPVPTVASLDGRLGHHGAAALFTAAACVSKLFDRNAARLPGWSDGFPSSVLVRAGEPDGGHGSLTLFSPGGAP
ncbi:MAG: beta-ketoacyl synthase N-terminal-like domain-containing protein [Deltaproteobacteria bacterium]|nr:beta-ketoacyl synthase N-terminal-like domain-containing protein [Deltaproteobacteria bacterium]